MNSVLVALKSTLVEMADSKKVVASFTSVVVAAIVMVGSKLGLSWLDHDTAVMIATLAVGKGAVYVLAQAHVDGKKQEAAGNVLAAQVTPSFPSVSVASSAGTSTVN